MKKRIKVVLFSLVSLCVILFCLRFSVTAEAATTLKNKSWTYDMATGKTPVEYTFVMPDSGYFYYEVQPTKDYVYLSRSNYEGGVKYSSDSDDTNYVNTSMFVDKLYESSQKATRKTGFRSSYYSFPKNTRVTITVFNSYGRYVDFRVRYVFTPSKSFETEWNDTKSKADALTKGKTINGVLMKNSDENGDVDWFVYTAPSTGKYKIVLLAKNEDINHGLTYDTWKGTKCIGSAQIQSGDGKKTIFNGKLTKGQKLYVKLYKGTAGTLYQLQVK